MLADTARVLLATFRRSQQFHVDGRDRLRAEWAVVSAVST
jgi:hypothetical protein